MNPAHRHNHSDCGWTYHDEVLRVPAHVCFDPLGSRSVHAGIDFLSFSIAQDPGETHVPQQLRIGHSMSTAQVLFISAASLMFLDAVGYSLGALRPLHQSFARNDADLNRRLLLNLMLANAGLYFTSLFTFAGAYIAGISRLGAWIIMALSAVVCFYSLATILLLTPKDWKHAISRGLAGLLIIAGFMK